MIKFGSSDVWEAIPIAKIRRILHSRVRRGSGIGFLSNIDEDGAGRMPLNLGFHQRNAYEQSC